MTQLDRTKTITFIILAGFIYSVILGIINTNKYDNYRILENGKFEHSIIRTDIGSYWRQAHKFKTDFEGGKNFFDSGTNYKDSYLYPKIIASYYMLVDKDIANLSGFMIVDNLKFGIPILNSLIFYLALIFFSKKLLLIFKKPAIIYYIIFFLSLEPTLTQYHSSYWSESLYLSLILIIFGLLLEPSKKISLNFLIGVLIGLSFLQRSVSLYLIIPVTVYYFFQFKKSFFIPLISCILGNLIVVFFLGYTNYMQDQKFSVIPDDQKDGPYYLLAHGLNGETKEEKYKKRDVWIKENNINSRNKIDQKKILDYQSQYFKDALKNNFSSFVIIHLKKSIQAQILNPFFVNNAYKQDKTIKNYWEKNYHLYKYKIPYSLLIYFFCFLGFVKIILKNHHKRLLLLTFLFIIYYTGILGWVGWNRYMVPNLIFLSIFFGLGLNTFIEYIKSKK